MIHSVGTGDCYFCRLCLQVFLGVMPSLHREFPGGPTMPITVPQKNAVDDFHYIARRVLLQKGKIALPRLVSQACSGMTTVEQIVLVMKELTRQGLGTYNPFYMDGDKSRKAFVKKPLAEVRHALDQFDVNEHAYEERYNEVLPVSKRKKYYHSVEMNRFHTN